MTLFLTQDEREKYKEYQRILNNGGELEPLEEVEYDMFEQLDKLEVEALFDEK